MSNDDTQNYLNQQRLLNVGLHTTIANNASASALSDIANSQLKSKVKALEKEVEFYKELLAKPFHNIAQHHAGFRKNFTAQQEVLADWMVSQKAFKELAINFGMQTGRTLEEVVTSGMNGKLDVLDSKNNADHNTNADTSEVIKPHLNALKEKLKK